jgi:hypothetical protein
VSLSVLTGAAADDQFVSVAPSAAAAACAWAARRLIGAELGVASPAVVAPAPALPLHVLAALRLCPDTVVPLADRLTQCAGVGDGAASGGLTRRRLFDVGSVVGAMPQTPAPTTPGARPSPGCITDM